MSPDGTKEMFFSGFYKTVRTSSTKTESKSSIQNKYYLKKNKQKTYTRQGRWRNFSGVVTQKDDEGSGGEWDDLKVWRSVYNEGIPLE